MIKYKKAFYSNDLEATSFSHEITMARLLDAEGNYSKARAYYLDAAKKARNENAKSLAREFERLAIECLEKENNENTIIKQCTYPYCSCEYHCNTEIE